MDIRRITLYMALALISIVLWNNWQKDYPPNATPIETTSAPQGNENSLSPPFSPRDNATSAPAPQSSPANTSVYSQNELIHVKTDVLDVGIDLKQGDIVKGELLAYPASVENKSKPFVLLQNQPNERYVANSNLFATTGQSAKEVDVRYTSSQKEYQLDPHQDQLVVTLTGESDDGLAIKKEFIFTPGNYLIKINYQIANQGNNPWTGFLNTQLLRSSPKEDKSSMFHVGSYTGASFSNPNKKHYQKVSFDEMTKSNLDTNVNNGWIAMQQHYFLSAWVPNTPSENKFYTRAGNNDYTIGSVSESLTIKPNEQKEIGSKLYIGPEITSTLKSISPSLDLTVDYGLLWFLSSLLFSLMKVINNFVGNWGWSIVLVTILIKLAFYRLSATSYKSMAGMRKLQPKLQALKERYGDDKAKISQATMELYRQEKVNPLGGCLPIIIQIPVFIALYWVLLESVELRQAPFIFWIHDLASPDPYHILPLIMGATMLIQQKLNPAPPDPLQAKMMMFLPILFTGLFWNFPSGLVLYWIVNNTLSILQQWYITRKYSDDNKPVKKLAAATK